MTYLTTLKSLYKIALSALFGMVFAFAAQAQTHTGDVEIWNSLCVGFDCPAGGPSYGDSTILMMENNTRIKFGDTSSAASFPRNDWEIEANSSTNGGANYLGFNDCGTADNDGGCATDLVFAVEAGVRSSALYVESDGDIGIGTNNPATDIDIKTGNTPTVRLQQDGTSGFAPQSWDMAGNEAGFFIRDVTNGSTLPIRIRPGSETSAIDIQADDQIGIFTGSPDATMHIRRTDGTVQLRVEEASGTSSNTRIQLQLENNGSAQIALVDNNNSTDWRIQNLNDAFRVTKAGTGVAELEMDNAGNVTIQGTLTELSDKNAKMAIEPIDTDAVLAKVADLPISSWTYIHDADRGIRHIGPMAQDFYAAFGTGHSEKGISTLDSAGVALAAIKALSAENDAQKVLIAELSARLERLERLESRITAD